MEELEGIPEHLCAAIIQVVLNKGHAETPKLVHVPMPMVP